MLRRYLAKLELFAGNRRASGSVSVGRGRIRRSFRQTDAIGQHWQSQRHLGLLDFFRTPARVPIRRPSASPRSTRRLIHNGSRHGSE
jgi:hypothetical protein